jgi:pyruvate-ferredoxin/flavodoxin oxidoreductase
VSIDKHREQALELLAALASGIAPELVDGLLHSPQTTVTEIDAQRTRVEALDLALRAMDDRRARQLRTLASYLVRKSVWIVGGDGWAYDIGFGGLDHVLASGRNVNLLVLDTEVYSNTGGQASKATPRAGVAKFAAGGKQGRKKDLGLMAMAYGDVFVAQVAMGASPQQTLDAFRQAEAYEGPSLVIAYGHCIAHGIDMRLGLQQQHLAVACGHWPLYRFRPADRTRGHDEFVLDSAPPSIPWKAYAYNEIRYRMLTDSRPAEAERLMALAQEDVNHRWQVYEDLARRRPGPARGTGIARIAAP